MSKVAAHSTRIFFDEFQLSSGLSSFSQSVEQETSPVTTFEDAGPRRVVGNYDHSAEIAGFFDGVSGGIDATLDSALRDGAVHYIAIMPGSAAAGTWGREGTYKSSGEVRSGAVGGGVILESNHEGAGTIVRANMLENSAKTGTGAGTGRSIGATSSPAVTVVTARIITDNFSSLTFDIQDSDDNGSGDAYANVSGLDFNMGGVVGVQRKSITATTKLWKRVNIDAFAGTSALLVVTIGNAPS